MPCASSSTITTDTAISESLLRRPTAANVFCAVEPKAGRHFTIPTLDRSGFEFAQAMAELACQYPNAKTIHLVMDNLNGHTRKSLTDLYGEEFGGEIWDRFTVHYSPRHGSWLNQAEIEIGLFARQCLGKRRIPDLKTLRRESPGLRRRMNRDQIRSTGSSIVKPRVRNSATNTNSSSGLRPRRDPTIRNPKTSSAW